MKQKITILVNVHNRHRHLARQLDYIHKHYEHIMVFDSSDVEYEGRCDYSNVEYYYYPRWEYVDKLADIIQKVETPYIHLCADDDFYRPGAIFECVSFLEEHSDYASVHGHYFSFYWDGKHFDAMPLYKSYIGCQITDESSAERLKAIFSPYMQLLYGVHRTQNLKDSFSLAVSKRILNHRLIEILVSAIAVIRGKHRVLPIFYGMRETLYNSAGIFIPSVSSLAKEKGNKGEYERFINMVAEYLFTNGNTARLNECRALVSFIIQTYYSDRKRRLKRIPQLLPLGMRVYVNRFRFNKKRMAGAGISLSDNEVDIIRVFVEKHNITE